VRWRTHNPERKVGAVDEAQEVRWTPEVGGLLQRHRGSMSKRKAAELAGFSESTWRALELGVRRPAKGVEVPVNPTVGTLIAAADAVGVDRAQLLGLVGITYDGVKVAPDRGVDSRLDEIEERLAAIEAELGVGQRARARASLIADGDFVTAADDRLAPTQRSRASTKRPIDVPEQED
jgi:hypothetical protein